jgi:hypothetical protein
MRSGEFAKKGLVRAVGCRDRNVDHEHADEQP